MFEDLIVLLPGITGSVLTDPRGRDVWAPSGSAVFRALRSFGGSVAGLELATDPGASDDLLTATRLVPDVSLVPGLIKIDGYGEIARYLMRELGLVEGQNYHPFPYDWRKDNRESAAQLQELALHWLNEWRELSRNANAKLVLIAHSMGGLVARWFVECLGGFRDTRLLITLGTPHRGALNALGFIEHGMKKGVGPFGVDLSPLLRSCPSVYQLLPTYPCIVADGAPERVVEAAERRDVRVLQYVDAARAQAAREFHRDIITAQAKNAQTAAYTASGYTLVPVIGITQPTAQSLVSEAGRSTLTNALQGEDLGGDGTVPRVSALPIELEEAGREVYAAESHGALQNAAATLAFLRGILTRTQIDFRKYQRASDTVPVTMEVDDVVLPGEALRVRARPLEGAAPIAVTFAPLAGGDPIDESLAREDSTGWQHGEFDLPAGAWRVTARSAQAGSVSELVVVAES